MRALVSALALGGLLVLTGSANAQEQQPGTISPGMTEQQVRDALGSPDNRSSRDQFTYYFYANNCHVECGMADLVIFQGGQLVDAILRARWRTYTGESSSPNGVQPRPTPMRLQMPEGAGGQADQPSELQGIEVRPAGQPAEADTTPMQAEDTTAADTTSNNGG